MPVVSQISLVMPRCVFAADFSCDGGSQCVAPRRLCDAPGVCVCVCLFAADFSCDGGSQCVAPRKLCDGSADCADGTDEAACEAGWRVCPAGQAACRDRRVCVHLDWRCDGRADCPDGSDELDCGPHTHRYWRARGPAGWGADRRPLVGTAGVISTGSQRAHCTESWQS